MSDSLSNLLSQIQNGQKNRILVIQSFKSKVAIAVLNILQDNGYIRGYRYNSLAEYSKVSTNKKVVKNDDQSLNHSVFVEEPTKNRLDPPEGPPVERPAQHGDIDPLNAPLAMYQQNKIFKKDLDILLKYKNQEPVISKIIRISKPSKRVYISINQIKEVALLADSPPSAAKSRKKGCWNNNHPSSKKYGINTIHSASNPLKYDTVLTKEHANGFSFLQGVLILSTSKGIMSHNTAYKLNIGGELICHVF